MPFLPLAELTERAAYVEIAAVLCEPDPRRGDVRAGLRPGLLRDDLEGAARHRAGKGDALAAGEMALAAVRMPSALSSRLAWQKAWPDIQLASQLTWFLVLARLLGEDRFAT